MWSLPLHKNRKVLMSHRNARLTFHGRLLLVERIQDGQPVSHVAKAAGVSRQCATKWRDRFDAEGVDGLHDRTSRPHLIAHHTYRDATR